MDPTPSNKSTKAASRNDNIYAMDIEALSRKSRERLVRQFLPDIERSQAKLGYLYKVSPFNYNSEHFNTVEIRRKPAATTRPLRDTKVVMKCGFKAANEIEPRPLWVVKPLQFTEKTYLNPNEEYTVFTRFYPWQYRDSGMRKFNIWDKSVVRSVVSDVPRSGTFEECDKSKGPERTRRVQTS